MSFIGDFQTPLASAARLRIYYYCSIDANYFDIVRHRQPLMLLPLRQLNASTDDGFAGHHGLARCRLMQIPKRPMRWPMLILIGTHYAAGASE